MNPFFMADLNQVKNPNVLKMSSCMYLKYGNSKKDKTIMWYVLDNKHIFVNIGKPNVSYL